MSLSPRLDLRQSQTLIMTPQLQQAIKLLQMSNQELSEFVATEIEQNPLLERADDQPAEGALAENVPTGAEDFAHPGQISAKASSDAPPSQTETIPAPDDEVWASDGYSGEESFGTSHNNSFESDEFQAAQNVAVGPSLRAHLLGQIHIDFIEAADRLIAAALVELLDEAGYLPADLDLVRTQLGATPAHFEAVIKQLQSFDPPGIFARSLQECLEIQLREKDRFDPAMEKLVQHLDLIAKRERGQLIKLCGVDAEDLADMITEIRELNPKPAMSFTSDVAPPIVPDVILRPAPGAGWHVELNNDNLPRVLANEKYHARVQAGARSKSDREYISDRWQQANWLVKALNQRATTILKVASEIVRQQDKFFIHGVQHLKPLILRDIAAAVEMHESTVSRVTQNKYITTPRGLFELKYFFTTALAHGEAGEMISSEAVRDRIRTLIDDEEPEAVLSDDRLAEILSAEGIAIARRTVAKYREGMRIASSAQRRRDKRTM